MDLADDLGQVVQQWVTRVVSAADQLVAGDLDQAERLSSDALSIGATAEPDTAMDYVSILLWTLRWMQGRLGEIAGLVEEVSTAPGADVARRLGAAVTHAELGRPAEARAILDALTDDVLDAMHVDSSWYVAMAAMAEAAYLDRPHACGPVGVPTAHAICRPHRDDVGDVHRTGRPSPRLVCLGARRPGRRDSLAAPRRHIADRCGAPAFGARSRVELAAMLIGLGPLDRSVADRVGDGAGVGVESTAGAEAGELAVALPRCRPPAECWVSANGRLWCFRFAGPERDRSRILTARCFLTAMWLK